MFIPVQVEPEVGESAVGYSLPYMKDGQPTIDYVQGLIRKINKEKKLLKLMDYKMWIPYHRIIAFTFGGIELENTEYDSDKRYNEDEKTIKRLLGNNPKKRGM